MAVDYAGAEVEWVTGTTTLLDIVKDKLGITDTAQDDDLKLYINMAGVACENYIDNKIVSQPVTELFAMSKTPIALRYWPAADLTEVVIDGTDVTADWELMTSDGIVWSLSNRHSASRVDYFNQMSISYTAGYDPVPGDIGYAIAATSIGYYTQSGISTSGQIKKEVVQGVGSVEYTTDSETTTSTGLISSASIGVLEMYRRYHV